MTKTRSIMKVCDIRRPLSSTRYKFVS